MFILRRRWQSSQSSMLEKITFPNYKNLINSILNGEKGWIEDSLRTQRAELLSAKRYDLLLYLLSRHMKFLVKNEFIKEIRTLDELEIVPFLRSLDYKEIGRKSLDHEYEQRAASKLLVELANLGDYKLLEKYLDGLSKNISFQNQRYSKLACLSVSKEAFDKNDPIKLMGGIILPTEVSTVLKCYATHAPEKYEEISLYLQSLHPWEFSNNFNIMTQQITFYLKTKNVEKVKSLLELLFSQNKRIDRVLTLCVVTGLFENDLPSDAVAFFSRVTRLGYDPGSKAYSAMIIGCINHGMQMTAYSYYHEFKHYLQKRGEYELPTLGLYRAVMVMFQYLGDFEAAEQCFQELRDSKIIKPNSFIYSIMMYLYLCDRQPNKVIELYDQMVSEGILINDNCIKLYAMAIGGKKFRHWYRKFRLNTTALLKSGKMTARESEHLKNTFLSIFEYIISHGRDYRLGKLVSNDIESLGLDLSPYMGYRFRIACASFDHEMVEQLLYEYQTQDLNFDKHAQLGYITYLLKRCHFKDCQAALEAYHTLYHPTETTIYYSLKCNFFDKKKFPETLERFKDCYWDGRAYAIVIHYYGRDRQFDTCIQYWNEFLGKDKMQMSSGTRLSKYYHIARMMCVRSMLWTCVWNKKYEMLKTVWLEAVIGFGLDPEHFKIFHNYVVPDGGGSKKLIAIT